MSKLKSHLKLIVIFTIATLIVLSTAFVFLQLRNSVTIKPKYQEDIAFHPPLYRQGDEKWSSLKLGNSSFTMKSSGCLTCCIASALSTEDEVTPLSLNKIFSENNVYDSQGNIQWQQVESLGYKVYAPSAVSEEDVYAHLSQGHLPIVLIRVNGLGSFHYVLITGISEGDYICMDPLKKNFTKLSDYWNRVYSVRVVYR